MDAPLDALDRFTAEQGIDQVRRLTPTILRAFIASLLDRPGLKPVSARTCWRAVRAFARSAEGLLDSGPTARLGPLKVDAPAPKTVAPADLRDVVSSWNPRTFLGARNRTLIFLLFDT